MATIQSKAANKQYQDNYDKIFGKKEEPAEEKAAESYTPFVEVCQQGAWYTVKDLREILNSCPDTAMVCTINGPVRTVSSEPGANESFVYLGTPE